MKKLQNNFTTPEQSKRLLKLGVPADSADFYCGKDDIMLNEPYPYFIPTGYTFSRYSCDFYIPCWSVGRLIEIMLICHIGESAHIDFDKSLFDTSCLSIVDWTIRVLESAIKCQHIDFSKLED